MRKVKWFLKLIETREIGQHWSRLEDFLWTFLVASMSQSDRQFWNDFSRVMDGEWIGDEVPNI